MTMETLISLQSTGHRSIGEPTAPRPIGVEQGAVLVVLDVNKAVSPAALYWALANVVRKGDNIKILGIISHIANAMGFMIRVDQSTRNSPNIMELQFEIATKKDAIWRTAHVKEWCQRAGVKLEVDVKAGNNPKVIAIDEAKAMGAYHVVLDKNMKKDRKYFVDNLTCFVSRFRSSGGVDAIRSFAMPMISSSNKLPPMTPKGIHSGAASSQPGHQSKASVGSNSSHRGASSMSSTSFELGGESSDDYSAQEGDPLSAPSTGESMDRPFTPDLELKIRTAAELAIANANAIANNAGPKQAPNLYNLLRAGPVQEPIENAYNMNVNPLRKPTVRKWLNDDDRIHLPSDLDPSGGSLTPRASEFEFRFEPQPLTPRNGQRGHYQHTGSNGWIGHLNVAPEMGQSKSVGRQSLNVTLRTQASFKGGRKHFRQDKVSMDMHWPLMHWADSRRGTKLLRTQYASQTVILASNNSMNNFRTAVRKSRVPVSSGLNYSDMVDSD